MSMLAERSAVQASSHPVSSWERQDMVGQTLGIVCTHYLACQHEPRR